MVLSDIDYYAPRECLREPIAEIFLAAHLLDRAVGAHLAGDSARAEELFRKANLEPVRDWLESLWGAEKNWPDQKHYFRIRDVPDLPPRREAQKDRMPDRATREIILERDGYNCRYCGIPVVPEAVRRRANQLYPDAVPWGRRNVEQHAAFQCLWLQYDHVVPFSYGGDNSDKNIVISCAGCNYGKSHRSIQQHGLRHPLGREAMLTSWDGLMRLLAEGASK